MRVGGSMARFTMDAHPAIGVPVSLVVAAAMRRLARRLMRVI